MSVASVLSVRQDYGWPKDVVWARWGRQWTTSFHELAAGIKPFSVYFSQLHVSASAVVALAGPVPQIDEVRRRAEALLSNAGFPAAQPSTVHCTLLRCGTSGLDLADLGVRSPIAGGHGLSASTASMARIALATRAGLVPR